MAMINSILSFIFKKKLDRELSLKNYLQKFDDNEIRYIHSILITAISSPFRSDDLFNDIDLSSYLFAHVKISDPDIIKISKTQNAIRAVYKVGLSKRVTEFKFSEANLNTTQKLLYFSDFKLAYCELDSDRELYLSRELSILKRIYKWGSKALASVV